jgi:PAS domain S-box-containing protein
MNMSYLRNFLSRVHFSYLSNFCLTRYIVAALSVVVALLMTLLLQPLLSSTVFSLFFAAVTFSAWYGGLEAGILATILSIVGINYFLNSLAHTFQLWHGANLLHLVLFTVVALLVSSLNAEVRSARQRAESNLAKLKLSEERYRRIVDTAYEGIWLLNVDMQTEYVNQRLAEMLGYGVEEMRDRSFYDFIDPANQTDIEIIAKRWKQGFKEQFDYCFRCRDGYQMWAIVSSTPILTSLGKFNGVLVMLTDITNRQQVEAERIQLLEREQVARAEAEAANRIKDEFLAVLSHELRSPLSPILGWIQILQRQNLDRATTHRALAIVEYNAKLQTQLIEDLFDVSRILRGKLSLEIHPVDLVSTIEAAIEAVRLSAEIKAIELKFSFVDSECESKTRQNLEFSTCHQFNYPKISSREILIAGDPKRLQQIMWNLLSNAVKFTPKGGRVEVQLSVIGSQGLIVSNREQITNNSYAQIRVVDTGKGIHPDFLPHVFESFQQADNTTTRKFGGLGLGLAIVRHLVELHGGTVEVESQGEGQGATFTVKIPLLEIAEKVEDAEETEGEISNDELLGGVKVLVVDDNPNMLELMTFVLKRYGAIVTTVTSAKQALRALVDSESDIMLSDIGMPDVDGCMLMRQIRTSKVERIRQIPAIALTAYASDRDRQQARAAGFQTHLAKPVELASLIAAIANLTERKI